MAASETPNEGGKTPSPSVEKIAETRKRIQPTRAFTTPPGPVVATSAIRSTLSAIPAQVDGPAKSQAISSTPVVPQSTVAARSSSSKRTAAVSGFGIDNSAKKIESLKGFRRIASDPGKHRPYTPHGTVFKWEDNPDVPRQSPYKLGVPNLAALKLRLKSTSGIVYCMKYVRRKTMEWNSKSDIADAHKWRKQCLDRTCNKNHKTGKSVTDENTRPHWTQREQISLLYSIRAYIKRNRRKLNKDDWKVITDDHNARFKGQQISIGEQTAAGFNNKGLMSKSSTVKKVHDLTPRSKSAIQSQAHRWPEVKKMMDEEYAKLFPRRYGAKVASALKNESAPRIKENASRTITKEEHDAENDRMFEKAGGESEDGEENDEDEENSDEDENSGRVQYDLDDSSDDEVEDQRPASNQTGAVPVPV